VASSKGRNKRHTHRVKRPVSDGFVPYMASKLCEVCGKQCYSTREDAKHSARVNHPGKAMHVYYCEEPSGIVWWHLSSIPADKLTQLRDRKHDQ
jgi:hypothetical protein